MKQVSIGDVIKIHFTAKLASGTISEISNQRKSLEFRVGSGQVFPGIDKGVIGMKTGDQRSIEVKPEDGFGLRREDLVMVMDKRDLPDHIDPYLGQRLKLDHPECEDLDFCVVDMNTKTITLDANHPFAGYTLYVDIELIELKHREV